ncbi:hypothetical protein [Peptoniphilus stercorisuis]|uniref:ABC-type transport system involved in multi-copper enzyme maturation permease subunit n=1 Tax=Peptoniphilus stercorisuis TaxID=1436965 RepID=A0ABS4KBV2_9FIRM|nr:hypothetical protein [Peptoniphilus stercorisuis]MBP2025254.1 ABC-type transport system involved in multi-copper enzyme maturation permease subunit [Peptoniphilus stercorisuis]
MDRYLKAEFKRVFTKTGNLISLLIIFAIVIGGNILINQGVSVNGPISPNSTPKGGIPSIAIMIGTSMALSAANWMVLFVGAFVMGDERKERAYLRVVESGISRSKIVISKFIVSFVVAIIVLFVSMLLHFTIVYFLFGWNSYCTEIVKFFLLNIGLEIIPLISILSILLLIYFVVKNEFLVTILFILFGIKIHSLLRYISMFSGRLKYIIAGIASFSPSGVFSKISSNAFSIIGTGDGPFILEKEFVNSLIPQLTINAILALVVIGITIVIMNRRNLD